MANTAIGELEIHWRDKSYLLRPSFKAIMSLDDYHWYAGQCGDAVRYCLAGSVPPVNLLMSCYSVLIACHDGDLPLNLIGEFVGKKSNQAKSLYKQGAMQIHDLCVIANHLMKWGIYGEPSQERIAYAEVSQRNKSSEPLDLQVYVGIACAPSGLGKSMSEAWGMTMREFQIAYEAQFPLTEKQKSVIPPPPEVREKLMAQIMAAREKAKSMPKQKPMPLNRGR